MPPLLAEPSLCHWSSAAAEHWLHDQNGKVLRNLDSSDLLKTDIAYNTWIFTAMTRNHGNGQKPRYTVKITVITAIVNSWFSHSPNHYEQIKLNCRHQHRKHHSSGFCTEIWAYQHVWGNECGSRQLTPAVEKNLSHSREVARAQIMFCKHK